MTELRRLADSPTSTRPYVLLLLDSLADWPEDLTLNDERFSLFMVLDERDVAGDGFAAWKTFTERAINQGLAYFSTWGPDCQRLHDLMDQTLISREADSIPGPTFLMTTWSVNESLEDALEFFRDCALDFDLQNPDSAPGVVALVGRPDLAAQIEAFPFGRSSLFAMAVMDAARRRDARWTRARDLLLGLCVTAVPLLLLWYALPRWGFWLACALFGVAGAFWLRLAIYRRGDERQGDT